MKTIIFKIVQQSTGKEWRIFSNGEITGFPDNCFIENFHSAIVDQLDAKLLIASECPTRKDKESALGKIDISD